MFKDKNIVNRTILKGAITGGRKGAYRYLRAGSLHENMLNILMLKVLHLKLVKFKHTM